MMRKYVLSRMRGKQLRIPNDGIDMHIIKARIENAMKDYVLDHKQLIDYVLSQKGNRHV